MKLSILVASALATTGLCSFKVETTPAGKKAHRMSKKARDLVTRQYVTCKNNSDCANTFTGDQCYDNNGDRECNRGYCSVVVRNTGSFCSCFYSGVLVDSCARGHPNTDDYTIWCVYNCGDKGGNGQCDSTTDPCKGS
ncbi:hypothetical protein BKA65DRAFT_486315 [Rhexocercosporidium sp. MPI-PUGE-AT-0058]|nr:hypothetical protein BKA65DRAFT_486315 [Rhexocercosporidium sp. MPI-PUGE-AT-0058]